VSHKKAQKEDAKRHKQEKKTQGIAARLWRGITARRFARSPLFPVSFVPFVAKTPNVMSHAV
jgi:hypothetical protein